MNASPVTNRDFYEEQIVVVGLAGEELPACVFERFSAVATRMRAEALQHAIAGWVLDHFLALEARAVILSHVQTSRAPWMPPQHPSLRSDGAGRTGAGAAKLP